MPRRWHRGAGPAQPGPDPDRADPAKDHYVVLIKPGLSQLSTRQILNRLLGGY